MKKFPFNLFILFILGLALLACDKNEDEDPSTGECCPNDQLPILNEIDQRNFKMGFTTWPYNDQLGGQDTTYAFLRAQGDIYAEHIDDKIPWSAWIDSTALPQEFVNNIQGRKGRRINGNELLVSVSLFNNLRTDLAEDYNGSTPAYDSLNQPNLIDAYFKHLDYIITELQPDQMVLALEVNEILRNNPGVWPEYLKMINEIRPLIKNKYPNLPLSESVTLHNLANASSTELQEVSHYINSNHDFASVSLHPHLGGLNDLTSYRQALQTLNANITLPIAVVETSALAEDLIVPNLSINIPADEQFQKALLEELLLNAHREHYQFIIWWCHRDYDSLWQTFPPSVKDLGQLWRDTGLLDEDGNERSGFAVWEEILSR